jgi:hypothetical protein
MILVAPTCGAFAGSVSVADLPMTGERARLLEEARPRV